MSTTFGLPPLGGKVPLAWSAGHKVGDVGGTETVTLSADQIPAHTHAEKVAGVTATNSQNAILSGVGLGGLLGAITKPPTTTVADGASGSTGGGKAHDNMPHYLALAAYIYAGMPKT